MIDVESTPGAGTTFRILLPRDSGTAEAGGTRSTSSGFVAGGRETVLLVEDEEAVRAVARRILQKFGYTVIEAANGAEALATLERRPGAVDLVVSDLIMPVLGGHELTERIASMESTLPVLITSGYTEVEILRQGSLRPGTRFLGKPFTVEALTRSVREMLDRKPDTARERATG